ncbi:hypothetical protein BTI55_08415 [Lactobacillus delbrueckii subsp. bulgaricus]|nr:hypothetical protein [Lactobacillus delbrueckii subsp. bulgaricus]
MIYEGSTKLVEEELKELGQLYSKEKEAGQRIIEQLLDDELITPEQFKRVCDYLADSYFDDLADIHFEDTAGGTPVYSNPVYSNPVYSNPVYSNPVYSNEDEVETEWEDMPIKEQEDDWEGWEDWMDTDDTDDTWTNTWITYGGRSDDTDSQDNTDEKRS